MGRRFPELRGHFQRDSCLAISTSLLFRMYVCRSPISSPPPLTPCPSALRMFVVLLITLRMKCRCPYSASAMIGHVPSVERLYPAVGKHELQSLLL